MPREAERKVVAGSGSTRLVVVITVLFVLALVVSNRAETLEETAKTQIQGTAQARPTSTPTPNPQPEEEIDPDDVIRVKISLVNSPVLIIGRNGKFVPNLRGDDFEIFEDGVKQDIAYFAPVDTPVSVALLIDTSRSTVFNLVDIQDAAIAFLDSMRTGDQALVVTFADEVAVLAEPTSDRELLRRAIRSARPGGGTRVYDAVDFALKDRLAALPGRKAVILFSDGVDNASRTASEETNVRSLRNSDTLIYPVQFNTYNRMKSQNEERQQRAPVGSGFNDQDYLRANNYLHLLANLSGTGVYSANEIGDLDKAVASIVDELHNEYSVGYYPRNPVQPGEVRRIEVRVSLRQLVVKARTAYVVDTAGVAARIATSGGRMTSPGPSSNASMPIPRSDEGPQLQLGARWICKGPDVPSDFIVVKEGFVAHCPASTRASDNTNAWFIRKPGQIETLCKGFLMWNGVEIPGAPLPTGYVVKGEIVSTSCAKSSNAKNQTNAWRIRLPRDLETICKGFQIPRGHVVVGEQKSSECAPRAGANAWVIRTKE
jgi:Ca-activated chloride channel homolog